MREVETSPHVTFGSHGKIDVIGFKGMSEEEFNDHLMPGLMRRRARSLGTLRKR